MPNPEKTIRTYKARIDPIVTSLAGDKITLRIQNATDLEDKNLRLMVTIKKDVKGD